MCEEDKITCFQDLFDEPDYNNKIKKTHRKLYEMGQMTSIQAFKYDGTLYRQYEGAKIVANLEDFVVVLLYKTKVSEDEIKWVVSEPTLFLFAKNRFYNASITLNKSKGNYIYVNLASPFFIENEVIKYIDFDLDIKSYGSDKEFNVIDWYDFKTNIKKMKYSLKLVYKLYDELDYLYDQHNTKNGIFSSKLIKGLEKMLKEAGDL
ncbi:DUF402 domain-containing protein [Mycoplasma struthionis]|nr:DUF402 domain-containing protein [Mycoplasma struthionis]